MSPPSAPTPSQAVLVSRGKKGRKVLKPLGHRASSWGRGSLTRILPGSPGSGADFVIKDDELLVLMQPQLWSQPGRHSWTTHHSAAGLAMGASTGLSCCSWMVALRKARRSTSHGLWEWAV